MLLVSWFLSSFTIEDILKRATERGVAVRRDAGHKLAAVQQGQEPSDVKVLVAIGLGVKELRLWQESGTYRVVYVVRFREAIYVLHAFQKKTEATAKRDLDLVRRRYEEVRAMRQRV